MRLLLALPLLMGLGACQAAPVLPEGTPDTDSPEVWKRLAREMPRSVIPQVYMAYDALQRNDQSGFDSALARARHNATQTVSHQLAVGTLCLEAGSRQPNGSYRTKLMEFAIQHLTRARKLDPKGAPQAYNLGLALHRHDRGADAIPHLQTYSSHEPTDRSALRLIAEAYLKDDDPNLALQWIRRDTPGNPWTAVDWEIIGRCHYFLNRYEESEKAYRKSLAMNVDQSWVWNNLGLALRELGREKEAEECFAEGKRRRRSSPR